MIRMIDYGLLKYSAAIGGPRSNLKFRIDRDGIICFDDASCRLLIKVLAMYTIV